MPPRVVFLIILFGAVTTQVTIRASGASSEDAVQTETEEAVAKAVIDVINKECDALEADAMAVALYVVNAAETVAQGVIVSESVNGAGSFSISSFDIAKAVAKGIGIAIELIAKVADVSVNTTAITSSDLPGTVEGIKQGDEVQGQGLILVGSGAQVFVAAVSEALVVAKEYCNGDTVEAKDMMDVRSQNQEDTITNLQKSISLKNQLASKRRALLQTPRLQEYYNGYIVKVSEDSQGVSVRFENLGKVATKFKITLLTANNTEIDSKITNIVASGQDLFVTFPTAQDQGDGKHKGTSMILGQFYTVQLQVFDQSSDYSTVDLWDSQEKSDNNQKSAQGKLINTEGGVILIDDSKIKKLWPQEEVEITIQFQNPDKALIFPGDAYIKDTSSLDATKVSLKLDNIKNVPINYQVIISPQKVIQNDNDQIKEEDDISAAKEIQFTFMTERFVNVSVNIYQDSYVIKLLVSDKDVSGFDIINSSKQTTPIVASQQEIPVYKVDGKLVSVQDSFRQNFADINVTFQNNGSVPADFYVTLVSASGEKIFEKNLSKIGTNKNVVVPITDQSTKKLGIFYTVNLFVYDILNNDREIVGSAQRNVPEKLPILTTNEVLNFSGTIISINQITREKLSNFTLIDENLISVRFNNSGNTYSDFKLDLQLGDNDVHFSKIFENVRVGQEIEETFTTSQDENTSIDKLGDTYTVILYVFNHQSNKYKQADSGKITLKNPLQKNSN